MGPQEKPGTQGSGLPSWGLLCTVTHQCWGGPSLCHGDHGRSTGGPSCPCPSACALGGWNPCPSPGIRQPCVSAFGESWEPSRGSPKLGGWGGLGRAAGVRSEVLLRPRVAEVPPGLVLSPPRETVTCRPRGHNRLHPESWDFLELSQQVWAPGLGAGGVSPEGSLCSRKGAAPPAQQRRPGTRSSRCRGPEARRRRTRSGSRGNSRKRARRAGARRWPWARRWPR